MAKFFNKLIYILLILVLANPLFAGTVVLEGYYQNRNVYVQNSISAAGVGFCTYEVSVNGITSIDEINASAFEIDLSQYELSIGSPVKIKIKHKDDGCYPKVLNPDALRPNPTFETVFITVNKAGLLKWTTVNETSKLPYVIEQFKWNKWVQIGEVDGAGIPTTNYYSFQTESHAGLNKFRVKQKGHIDKTKYTPSVSYTSLSTDVSYVYNQKKKNIEFSENTSYEVYDKYGNIVKKGFGSKINVRNLKKDVYYMNFGNTMGEFKRK